MLRKLLLFLFETKSEPRASTQTNKMQYAVSRKHIKSDVSECFTYLQQPTAYLLTPPVYLIRLNLPKYSL